MSLIESKEVNEEAKVEETTTQATEDTSNESVSTGAESQDSEPQVEESTASGEEVQLFAGKYKTPEDLEAGYKELTKKLREKLPEAPEKYEIDFSEDVELRDVLPENYSIDEDPLFQSITEVAKKHNISNEAMSELARAKFMHDKEQMIDPGEEMKKLGSDGQSRIKAVETFVQRNFTPEQQDLLASIATTAEGVEVLEKITKMNAATTKIPSGEGTSSRQLMSSEDLQKKALELSKRPDFDFSSKLKQQYEELMDQAALLDLGRG